MKNGEKEKFAGLKKVEVVDDHLGVTFPVFVMYPTRTPEKEEFIGPYSLNVAKDAKPQDDVFPLVVISHGTGGTPLVYRTLARHLVQNGFIVAMPEHPYNNIHDNQLENSVTLLESRPGNITQTIDWFKGDDLFKNNVNFDDISIIGHSMGGYTAIAATGGIPTTLPWETDNQVPEVIDLKVEERIKKVILLAPALGWFRNEGALEKLNLPILMMTGERDEITPYFHAEILLKGVGNTEKIESRTIDDAGHFSFLSPFPKEMKKSSFPPSQDPAGFDRELFHQELESDVLNFLLS
ncbi:alpha/beta hydrolase family protein [Halobacillus litoralis]|uniref:Alpha/beta hydrolase n=1 Tax=Halobacillus litoralis TaxID=45668 RepID=A0A410MA00_9BACI|nr:alpha/beta hydrolase [Halobacillus litoralis]QAS51503.1 alpha/beta hydrolase [Halobacillus litoralis]